MSYRAKKYPIYSKDVARLSKEADYLILYSNRSTGKSYAVKEYVLKEAFEKGAEFVYLRRKPQEIKDIDTVDYFTDMDVSKLTKGEYQYINVFRRRIYFAVMDDEGKLVNKKKIGYVMDLHSMESKKSLMYPKVETIVFEEYVTEEYYLPHEADYLLPNLVSSIARDRKLFVIMIGNKVSKFNPYVQEWNLSKMMNQETGTIDTYHFADEGGKDVTIKAWNIPPREDTSGMHFGNAAKNIDGDTYKTQTQNKLDGDVDEFKVVYTVAVSVHGLTYLMQFLRHKNDPRRMTWYVTPKTTPIKKGTRTVTDRFTSDVMTTQGFKPLTEGERVLFNYLWDGQVAYVSNLIGTEFKQALAYIGSPLE